MVYRSPVNTIRKKFFPLTNSQGVSSLKPGVWNRLWKFVILCTHFMWWSKTLFLPFGSITDLHGFGINFHVHSQSSINHLPDTAAQQKPKFIWYMLCIPLVKNRTVVWFRTLIKKENDLLFTTSTKSSQSMHYVLIKIVMLIYV